MILQKFFAWADGAPADQKAIAAASLARAYLAGDFMHLDKQSVELALTSLLDDFNPGVRVALAEVFAGSPETPRHIVLALASDVSVVSSIVLAKSPLLNDEELVDCAAIGDVVAQTAVASRVRVSPSVAAALAEVGEREALLALLGNARAEIAGFSLRRIFERFPADGDVREALLVFDGLPSDLRIDIASRTAALLQNFVVSRGWLKEDRAARAVDESLQRTTVSIAADSDDGARALAAHLRFEQRLTPSLLFRSLLSADRKLFEATLAELTGQPHPRVCGLVENWSGAGFAALYAKAALPAPLLPVFRAALAAQDEERLSPVAQPARLRRRLVERVLAACGPIETLESTPVITLLRRLACEAARDEARAETTSQRTKYWPLQLAIDLDALEAELIAA